MTTTTQTAERLSAPGGVPARRRQLTATLVPLIVDVAIPIGGYYLLRGLGVGMVTALAVVSVPPLLYSVARYARRRHIDTLALLILAVNVAAIATSFLTGSARLMMAKDSVLSSVVGIGALVSVWRGAPVMTAGLKPYLTKGRPERIAAFDRLRETSDRFLRLERRYTMIWGAALLGDSVARVAGVALLPVSTMVWLSTVLVVTALLIAMVVSGATAAEPMRRLILSDSDEQNGVTR